MFKTKRQIQSIKAREILDSRGNPTVEAVVILNDGSLGRACAPSGASTGKHERAELRDHDPSRYLGKGVQKAVDQIYHLAAPALIGCSVSQQQSIDQRLLSLIDPDSEQGLASNVLLPLSLACAKAAASSYHLPLYRYLGGAMSNTLPMPMMNLLNGGAHASNNLDIQEFMVIPVGAQNISQAIEWCSRIHHRLGELLCEKGLSCGVGDEGGFAPNLTGEEEAFLLLTEAGERANLCAGKDFVLALDAAASEWCAQTQGCEQEYLLPKSQLHYNTSQLISYWEGLCAQYPIRSLEDPLGENDWQGFGAADPSSGQPHTAGGRRPVCHRPAANPRRNWDEGCQCGAHQAQPDWHPQPDHRSCPSCTAKWVSGHPVSSLRRNGGQQHRRPCGCHRSRTDQSRRSLPRRTHRQI